MTAKLGLEAQVIVWPKPGGLGTIFDNKVSIEEANKMAKDVTDEEIKKALFDMDDNKAPGPDGFTSKFYKKAWDIVKYD
ncbi:hypothetical protein Tco_0244500, partial [Tanacetum coccineum]